MNEEMKKLYAEWHRLKTEAEKIQESAQNASIREARAQQAFLNAVGQANGLEKHFTDIPFADDFFAKQLND